jgi:ParB family chromosome partitioning protein
VTKARILQAVREARSEQAAQLIDHLKKGEMAERAQELLAGSAGCRNRYGRSAG